MTPSELRQAAEEEYRIADGLVDTFLRTADYDFEREARQHYELAWILRREAAAQEADEQRPIAVELVVIVPEYVPSASD